MDRFYRSVISSGRSARRGPTRIDVSAHLQGSSGAGVFWGDGLNAVRCPVKWSIDNRQRRKATFSHAVRGQIGSPRTPLALDWGFPHRDRGLRSGLVRDTKPRSRDGAETWYHSGPMPSRVLKQRFVMKTGVVSWLAFLLLPATGCSAKPMAGRGAGGVTSYGGGNSGTGGTAGATATGTLVQGVFKPTGSMAVARYAHTATLLGNGRVLVAGGFLDTGPGNYYAIASAELYDPATAMFAATGSMSVARVYHTATMLGDGRVLLAGGTNDNDLASAELYDPATETFTVIGSMTTARSEHDATILGNGKVLITGGTYDGIHASTSAEVYDAGTGTFTATGSMLVPRYGHTATMLGNGKVLAVGGYDGSSWAASAEIYDAGMGTFAATGSMTTSEWTASATILQNGKVLVICGTRSMVAALYDPSTGTFSATSSPTVANGPSALLLNDGKLLVAGGYDGVNFLPGAELFAPATETFAATGNMSEARNGHSATMLPGGRVLVAGGFNESRRSLASADLYQ